MKRLLRANQQNCLERINQHNRLNRLNRRNRPATPLAGFFNALLVVSGLILAGSAGSCDARTQNVRIALQDYRFDPSIVEVQHGHPIRLILVNEGREVHAFASRILHEAHGTFEGRRLRDVDAGQGLRMEPGRAITLTVSLQPGTYGYRCKIRGHRGMTGTFIVR